MGLKELYDIYSNKNKQNAPKEPSEFEAITIHLINYTYDIFKSEKMAQFY